MSIGIVDYGIGNIGSLLNAFNELEIEATVLSEPNQLFDHYKAVLPGVGNFAVCREELSRTGWDEVILKHAKQQGRPLLGI